MTDNLAAGPAVTVRVWEVVVRLPEEKVIVYEVPAAPVIPRLVKVATPVVVFTATVVVPTRVAPALTDAVTSAAVPVTALLDASCMVMAGWVLNAAPEAGPAALVVTASFVATAWAGGAPTVSRPSPRPAEMSTVAADRIPVRMEL